MTNETTKAPKKGNSVALSAEEQGWIRHAIQTADKIEGGLDALCENLAVSRGSLTGAGCGLSVSRSAAKHLTNFIKSYAAENAQATMVAG